MNETELNQFAQGFTDHFDVDQIFANLTPDQGLVLDGIVRVHQLEKENAELRYQATHDVLTGMPNRRAMDQHVAEYIKTAPEDSTVLIGFLDIDKFKLINDTHGHDIGDKALQCLAQSLQENVVRSRDGSSDLAARVGGDEFMFFIDLEDLQFTDDGIEVLKVHIRRRINDKLTVTLPGDKSINFKASVGLQLFSIDELRRYDIDVIKQLVDDEMYEQKDALPVLAPLVAFIEPTTPRKPSPFSTIAHQTPLVDVAER